VKLGGLGINKDKKWEEAQEKQRRIKEFSSSVHRVNNYLHKNSPKKWSGKKDLSARDWAKAFANTIKKPKKKLKVKYEQIEYPVDDIDRWAGRNQELNLRIENERIKNFYGLIF